MNKNGEQKNPTLQKIEDMMLYADDQIDKFPKPERSYEGMATRLKGTMARMADACMATRKCHTPKSLLKQLDELDYEKRRCSFYVDVAYKKKLFSFKNFEVINDYLDQIGKMTGSWINVVREAEKKERPSGT